MTTFTGAVTQCALSLNAIVASVPPQHFEGPNLAKPSNCAAMPRYCSGLEDPSGNPPRPCLFAADGNGGAAEVKRKRLTVGCAFCCPEAFEHAGKSRLGKRNIVTRMKQWRAMGSPVYEAVFTFGIPGMCLPEKEARDLRRRAGQVPKLNRRTSWLHKKKARLMTLLKGKPIPMTPELGPVGLQFFLDCTKEKPPSKTGTWGMEIHASVRRYDMYRQSERARGGGPPRTYGIVGGGYEDTSGPAYHRPKHRGRLDSAPWLGQPTKALQSHRKKRPLTRVGRQTSQALPAF